MYEDDTLPLCLFLAENSISGGLNSTLFFFDLCQYYMHEKEEMRQMIRIRHQITAVSLFITRLFL